MTQKQIEIQKAITGQYSYINKMEAIKYIKGIFGRSATTNDILIAYLNIVY